MKPLKNYYPYFLSFLFTTLFLHTAIASYNEDISQESDQNTPFPKHNSELNETSLKRKQLENQEQSQIASKRYKVFARPTFDTTFKNLLTNDLVRLDFIKTFTGISTINNTVKLDESLVPLKKHAELRTIFDDKNTLRVLEWINTNGDKIKVTGPVGPGQEIVESPMTIKFLRDLSLYREHLANIFPHPRNSQLDVICKLPDDSHVIVEIQVAHQDFWDKRALSYLAYVYSRQLCKGDEWSQLKRAIGVNILVGGPKSLPEWKSSEPNKLAKPIRHYCFQEKNDPSLTIPEMELIQYSLGNTTLEEDFLQRNKDLRDWIDYFKNAHKKDSIPEGASEALKKAYEAIEIRNMSKDMKEQYEKEKLDFDNFKKYTQTAIEHGIEQGKEIGKQEGIELLKKEKKNIALNLLKTGSMNPESISAITGLSLDDVIVLAEKTNTMNTE